MNKLICFFLLLQFSAHAQEFDCPVTGDSPKPKIQAADVLKNRSEIPKRYKHMTAEQLLGMRVTDDVSQHQSVSVKGYILDVKDGGEESCNCHSKTNKDTHIYLAANESADESEAVIVEVTPRMRERLGSTKELKEQFLHQHVTVYGYLFCDEEHKQNSTIDEGKGNHWRGTVWEVHPVTKIELGN